MAALKKMLAGGTWASAHYSRYRGLFGTIEGASKLESLLHGLRTLGKQLELQRLLHRFGHVIKGLERMKTGSSIEMKTVKEKSPV